MLKRTFKYCSTHKDDEKYMQKMCAQGWAAVKLIEGFWTFESCIPNQYFYRVCYLRSMNKKQVEELKKNYAAQGIEFVFRYSFWAIFRSTSNFELYTGSDERKICRKIFSPMYKAAIICLIILVCSLFLAAKINFCWLFLSIPVGIYGAICTWLAVSYYKLLKKL